MGDGKHEFCSEAWVAAAGAYLAQAAKGADLDGVEVTFNEVFTDAPAHLGPDDQGRIGWYLRVSNGEVEVARGILERADLCITADYQTVVPLARMVFGDAPDLAAEAQKVVEEATAGGRMRREGDDAAMASLPWAAGLHDALARLTA